MIGSVDFDKYWGVRISGIQYNYKTMSIAFDMYWTIDTAPYKSRLRFDGVSKCEFTAEKLFKSEVVELVSLEGKMENGGWRIEGELSNCQFTILCESVEEG
jgi:hypothetical protein